MKLSKLYSNNNDFKIVKFKAGLNVVIGYGNNLSENDSHNLGKTSIIKLIDYMLLKDVSKVKEHFLNTKKDFFENYEFYLELEANKKFITIKRSVNSKKVFLKIHDNDNQNYVNEPNWDFENLTLSKAKNELNKFFDFDLKSNYRKFLKFILRTQKDYDFKFKKNEVKDIDWKPYIMELFGYNIDNYIKLYNLKAKKDKLKDQISDYTNEDFILLEDKKNKKDIYSDKIKELEIKVKNFDYYKIDENVNDELIKKINDKISSLNKQKYNLVFDINSIKKSLKTKINTLDIQDIQDIYNDVKLYFPESLIHDYNSLLEFNKQISQERIFNLNKILLSKEIDLKSLNQKLEESNQKQKEAFKILETNKTIEKILYHNDELNSYKVKFAELNKELEVMNLNIEKNREVKEKQKEIDLLNESISADLLEETNELKKSICNNFKEYTKSILFDSEGRISIYPNKEGSPEMEMKLYSIASGDITAEDEGTNYNKHMKCCFDLAVEIGHLQNNSNYFLFLCHDGSIEASDTKLKIEYLKLINNLCENYNIQYFTTAIFDEISEQSIFNQIGENNIILKLTDEENYKGTLFGKRF